MSTPSIGPSFLPQIRLEGRSVRIHKRSRASLRGWLSGASLSLLVATGAAAQVRADGAASPTPSPAAVSATAGAASPKAMTTYRYYLNTQGLLVMAAEGDALRPIARLDLVGEKTQLLLHEQHVFVACGGQGVAIVDVAQPSQPVLRGYVAQGELVSRISLSSQTLLVWLQSGASLLIDVSNPATPKLMRGVSAQQAAGDAESPLASPPKRKGRPGLGLTIAGGATFGGLYMMTALWAGFEPTLAIPVVGALVAGRGERFLVPLGILMAAGQSAGLIMLITGAAKMSNAASSTSNTYSSLQVMPYASRDGFGLVSAGRF